MHPIHERYFLVKEAGLLLSQFVRELHYEIDEKDLIVMHCNLMQKTAAGEQAVWTPLSCQEAEDAQIAVNNFLADMIAKRELTCGEIVGILAERLESAAMYVKRFERHGRYDVNADEVWTPAQLAYLHKDQANERRG